MNDKVTDFNLVIQLEYTQTFAKSTLYILYSKFPTHILYFRNDTKTFLTNQVAIFE